MAATNDLSPATHEALRTATSPLGRRSFLKVGAVALGATPIVAACGSSSSPAASTPAPSTSGAGSASASAAKDFGEMSMQLSWVENVEFSGEYIADTNGYYKAEGFSSVNLITGGPSVTQDVIVGTGKAFIGISAPDITASAILKGADLRIVGAQYQKNPFAIMSLASNPIPNAEAMIGKKIGVQSGNEAVWESFLKANNIDPSKITKVPVGFDPLVLTTKSVDGWFSFITNEPNVLRNKGFKVVTFLLADYNYPLVSETYMVQAKDITANRDKIKAILRADIKGWKASLADPTLGPTLSVTKYGKTLGNTVVEQTLESKSQNDLILNDDTKKNGIFTITPELIAKNISTLKVAGIDITAEKLFDTSLIDEIYKEDPSLI